MIQAFWEWFDSIRLKVSQWRYRRILKRAQRQLIEQMLLLDASPELRLRYRRMLHDMEPTQKRPKGRYPRGA